MGSDYYSSLGVFFVVIMLVAYLIAGVVIVLTTIINWKLLEKMGKEGWKALIPVYNVWCICECIGVNPHWSWIVVVASMISSIIPIIGEMFALAVIIYACVVYYYSLAKAFNKDVSFAVLLYFFFPIAGFLLLKENYVGKHPFHDIVLEDWLKIKNPAYDGNEAKSGQGNQEVHEANVSSENSVSNEASSNDVCSNCGAQLMPDSKFCTNCGKDRN